MDDALVVQVRLQGGCTVITVAGEVDIATAPQLGHHLAALAGSGRPVIADLDQVSFIDAAGLRVLAAAARQAAAAAGSLHVVSGRYQVRRVFALTGLDRQIPLARTLAGALAGSYWGIDGIPHAWLGGMRGREIVQPLLRRLVAAIAPGESDQGH